MRSIAVLIFFLTQSTCYSQRCKDFVFRYNTDPSKHRICSSALLDDLKDLYDKLQTIHPDLYRYVTKEQLDSSYNFAVKQCSGDKTLLEFTEIVNVFLTSLKDSHTFINERELLFYRPFSRHYFPMTLTFNNNKPIIVKSWRNSIPAGAELIAINQWKIIDLAYSAENMAPLESFAWGAKRELSEQVLGSLINLKNPDKVNRYKFFIGQDTIVKQLKSPKFFHVRSELNSKSKPIDFQKLSSKKAILTIGTFSPNSLRGFKKKLDEVFLQIEKDSIQNLAIDLRDNTGGFILLQEYLMSFLVPKGTKYPNHYVYKRSEFDRFEQLSRFQRWRFKRIAMQFYPNGAIAQEWDFYNSPMGTMDTVFNAPILSNKYNLIFTGACTVFINGMSMSAAANFTSWFQKIQRGLVIGTQASGTQGGTFANPAPLFMNNTMIPVFISTMKINGPTETPNVPINPDVYISPSLEDYIQKNDPLKTYFIHQ